MTATPQLDRAVLRLKNTCRLQNTYPDLPISREGEFRISVCSCHVMIRTFVSRPSRNLRVSNGTATGFGRRGCGESARTSHDTMQPLWHHATGQVGLRRSGPILLSSAELAIRVANRLVRVSSFFALTTQKVAVLWYQGGCF